MASDDVAKLDDKDYLILKLLAQDSMTAFKNIAKQVGLSPPSVSARIRRLRETGVFSPAIHIDLEKLGITKYSLGLTLSTGIPPESRAKIIEKLVDEAAVVSILTTTGDHDLVVVTAFNSTRELTNFIDEKIRPIREIEAIHAHEILKVMKIECKNMETGKIEDLPIFSQGEKKIEKPMS